jgi:hypothetical protein
VVAPGWSKEFQSSDVESLLAEKNALTQPTRAIPMKLAIPLFQAASLEDDDYLQDLWASLLVNAANAASGVDLKRAYIEILEQMTPTEVKILEVIYSLPFDETLHHGVTTADLPDAASVAGDTEKIEQPSGPSDEVKLALANLDRLGCVTFLKSWGGGELYATVNPNFLGKSFVNACTLKNRI